MVFEDEDGKEVGTAFKSGKKLGVTLGTGIAMRSEEG